jgi:hypothetical protein
MKLDLLKEHYFYELTRKNELEGALSLPVACFTAVIGVVFTLATTFSYENGSLTVAFSILLGVVVIVLGLVFFYVAKAYLNPKYNMAPSTSDLLSHLAELQEHYAKTGGEITAAEKDFEKGLMEGYSQATTTNKKNNDKRADYLFKAKVSLVFSVLALALCAIPYAIKAKLRQPEPQKIQIVGYTISDGGEQMPDETNTNQTSTTGGSEPSPEATPQTPVSTDTVSPPPTFPANTATRTEVPIRPTVPSDGFLKKGEL